MWREECCGFGGTFSVKFPEVSGGMARTKIDSIQKTGATTVVSIDSSCLMQLQGVIDRAGPAHPNACIWLKFWLSIMHVCRFEEKIQQTLGDPRLQLAIYTATGRLIDHRAQVGEPRRCPITRSCATQANAIKKHTIENLDYYLEQLEANVGGARRQSGVLPRWRGSGGFRSGSGQGARRAHAGEIEIDDHARKSISTSAWSIIIWNPWRRISANTFSSSRTSGRITSWRPRCI